VKVVNARSTEQRSSIDVRSGSAPVDRSTIAVLRLGQLGHARERELPELVEPRARGREPARLEPIDVALPLALEPDQLGVFEDPQVLGHRGSAHGELGRDLADRAWPRFEQMQDRPSGLAPERIQHFVS